MVTLELRPNCLLTRSSIWIIHRAFSNAEGPKNSHIIATLLREHGYPVEECTLDQVQGQFPTHTHIWCDLALREDISQLPTFLANSHSWTWIDNKTTKSLENLIDPTLDRAISLAESEFISSK